MALLFAALSPVGTLVLLGLGTSWIYAAVDRGAPRALASVPILLALLLPCAQTAGVFWLTSSRRVRVVGALLAAASVPLNLVWLVALSWTHD